MKKIVKITLEGIESAEDYLELRNEMVDDLVNIEMDAPTPEMLSRYEEMLMEMFHNMDDDTLQNYHDLHIEFFKEKEIK